MKLVVVGLVVKLVCVSMSSAVAPDTSKRQISLSGTCKAQCNNCGPQCDTCCDTCKHQYTNACTNIPSKSIKFCDISGSYDVLYTNANYTLYNVSCIRVNYIARSACEGDYVINYLQTLPDGSSQTLILAYDVYRFACGRHRMSLNLQKTTSTLVQMTFGLYQDDVVFVADSGDAFATVYCPSIGNSSIVTSSVFAKSLTPSPADVTAMKNALLPYTPTLFPVTCIRTVIV